MLSVTPIHRLTKHRPTGMAALTVPRCGDESRRTDYVFPCRKFKGRRNIHGSIQEAPLLGDPDITGFWTAGNNFIHNRWCVGLPRWC